MPYAVRTLSRAEADAEHIFQWIEERSPGGARRWWLALENTCASLRQNALMHGLAPEAEVTGREIRQVLFKTPQGRYYRLLYVIVADEVRILRVRGPGQPDLTEDELH